MTKRKDAHLRTEAAIKKAVSKFKSGDAQIADYGFRTTEVEFYSGHDCVTIAIADLRDLYRKRAPLKGVMRKVRKAIQPKRKAGRAGK